MAHMGKHDEWLAAVTHGASRRKIAETIGFPQSTFNRKVNQGHVESDAVIAIARAFGKSPVEALVKTGYLTAAEASGMTGAELSRLLSDQELVREMAHRLNENEAAWAGTFGEVIAAAESSNAQSPNETEVPATLTDAELNAITTDAAITELEIDSVDDDRGETG